MELAEMKLIDVHLLIPFQPDLDLYLRVVFFQRMYPSILSFETIIKLKLFFEFGIPRPQDVGHLC
jgi:hypothetical protein